MDRQSYEELQMEVIIFETEDVITASNPGDQVDVQTP